MLVDLYRYNFVSLPLFGGNVCYPRHLQKVFFDHSPENVRINQNYHTLIIINYLSIRQLTIYFNVSTEPETNNQVKSAVDSRVCLSAGAA